jgi:hypothetical protein
MAERSSGASREAVPSQRMTRRIFAHEAYRRIMAGEVPETLSEFAAQLAAWFKQAYPGAPVVPASLVEETIRDTWHRRHDMIGSEL